MQAYPPAAPSEPPRRPRTPAQIEAARRNGARSRGPTTPEGKARSSANALRHGPSSAAHTLLEGEDKAAYEELLTNLIAELELGTELEGQLVRRLAAALWKQARADRLEAKLFAWTDTPKVFHAGKYLPVDAEANFDIARFLALERYQAQLGREVSRCLRELRLLRQEPLADVPNEPGPVPAADPAPEPASEPARPVGSAEPRNEPERGPSPAALPAPNRRERRRSAALARGGPPAAAAAA
jgi:hypothetical protein